MLQAIIFDFDGLIMDTEVADYEAWQSVYAEHGCSVPLDVWVPLIGSVGHGFDPCENLEALAGRPIDREAARAMRRKRLDEICAAAEPLPGVREVIASAKRLGLRVGLASSSPRRWIFPHLERLGLMDQFDCIRCADDVRCTKPNPEVYRSALDGLSAFPNEAIALEDSLNGMRAAQAAGIFCVVVPNALTRRLDLDDADLKLESLADLRLEEFCRGAGNSRPGAEENPFALPAGAHCPRHLGGGGTTGRNSEQRVR